VVLESRTDHLDPRPHDFDTTSRNSVSTERAIVPASEIVAALDVRVRLGPEIVFALCALRHATLLMPALIVRTLLRVSLVLMSAAFVSVAIRCLYNRSGQTQRECQSPNRNKCFA
jgi:hypothetical protein